MQRTHKIIGLILILCALSWTTTAYVLATTPSQITYLSPGSLTETSDFILWKEDSYYFQKDGLTGKITSSTNMSELFQSTVTALDIGSGGGARGSITIKQNGGEESDIIDISNTITFPEGNGNLKIVGNGPRNTILRWTGEVNGTIFYGDASGKIYLENIELRGGGTGTETGRALELSRTLGTESNELFAKNVQITRCVNPAVTLKYLADGSFSDVTIINNVGYDLKMYNSSHLKVYGGILSKTFVSESLFKMFGGTLSHIDVGSDANYGFVVSGVFFDPVPTGYGSHIILGSEGPVTAPLIEGCTFTTSAEDCAITLEYTRGATLSKNRFSETNDYINITSGAIATEVYGYEEYSGFPLMSKVTLSGRAYRFIGAGFQASGAVNGVADGTWVPFGVTMYGAPKVFVQSRDVFIECRVQDMNTTHFNLQTNGTANIFWFAEYQP